MAWCCAEMRLFSFDCVKRWRCIFALFPFNSLLTHPEALRVSSSEMTQTRAPEFANQCKLCSEHIIRSPIRKANIRPVWRKEKKRKCAIKLVREEKIFLTNKLKHCVPESERQQRCLHLMFAKADSPDSKCRFQLKGNTARSQTEILLCPTLIMVRRRFAKIERSHSRRY